VNCRICGAELPDGAMFCGECGSSTSATPESRRPIDPRPGDTYVMHRSESGVIRIPIDGLPPVAAEAAPVEPEVEPEPDVAMDDLPEPETVERPGRESATSPDLPRFVLTFSTGEVVTVSGDGLIGRRPMPEPGEAFAHLVQIVDRGLSVSKTHLEFGEHDGGLWIADRFSSNGTVVRRPGEAGLRCEPGRRVLVPRGSRVEIGEQAFTVD
jgi:hypothetical protein